jgi:acetyl/propionyl-CoA carboxylase alpha subunit/acetyl-CoA carboxylase carboxyltransferase component
MIANRGEIAIRVARTAYAMGIETLAVFSEDDAASLHVRAADRAIRLKGVGPAAYLDRDQLVEIARREGATAVHPGYGFLSEDAAFARGCLEAGLTFVGPSPQTLELFGDKSKARALAAACGVPTLAGTSGPTSLEAAREFLHAQGPGGAIMIKAVSGGGGRGMRPVRREDELGAAFARCASEALNAFGGDALYVEALLDNVRHVEVQIIGDGREVRHLFDRECSLQRRRQKIVELAPAVGVPDRVREALFTAATALGRATHYQGLGTVEFLVEAQEPHRFFFIETNPRLQVEHTVTEAITGLDLVQLQLEIAAGRSLVELGLDAAIARGPQGVALQCRVNLETVDADGEARPAGGVLSAYQPPSGPGVRVDGYGYAGYATNPSFDGLLGKVIAHAPQGGVAGVVRRAQRALAEFKIEGSASNLEYLQKLLRHPALEAWAVDTNFIAAASAEILAYPSPAPLFGPAALPSARGASPPADTLAPPPAGPTPDERSNADDAPAKGLRVLRAPLQGRVVAREFAVGDLVRVGQPLFILEAMKMEHVVASPLSGRVSELFVEVGESVYEDRPLAAVDPVDIVGGEQEPSEQIDLHTIRPDLAEVLERQRRILDEARPEAVARRRAAGRRTSRENIDDLCDAGTFKVNGAVFAEEKARVAVMAYDYTVLAGTQGAHNHEKLDRMAELALRWRLPTIFFTEGGGGRPGDTEGGGFIRGFEYWGRLSGAAPLIGVNSGRCFAGNAAILGCCDVIIATEDSTLGMGGPAMIEGGGLGVFSPEEIGPVSVMQANGTIDVLVKTEAEAVAAAKTYLAYFQGALPDWTCRDQRLLRSAVPENRLRAYDVRRVIELLADEGTVLELRPKFGLAMVTALARCEGRPVGVIANNPLHLGGAIDADAADKAARFMQLCEAFGLPILSLSDTPGNMVGPEAEKTGLIRHCSRLFVIGANLTVPLLSVVLRKSYGLGAIAMTGGSYQASLFCVSWPTGEFGGMGLEGSVKLGYRNELAAITDPNERKKRFDEMVAKAYAGGKALARAAYPALDNVIDPAETRRWVVAGLSSISATRDPCVKHLRWIDPC